MWSLGQSVCVRKKGKIIYVPALVSLVQASLCGLDTSLHLDVVSAWAPNRSAVSQACRDRTFADIEVTGLQGKHEESCCHIELM